MLLIDEDFVQAVGAGRDGPDMATWVVHDGKRVAKFQYVGTGGHRGYFTIVPVEKSGSQQRTEYLTDRPTSMAPSGSSPACAPGLAAGTPAAPPASVAGRARMDAKPADGGPYPASSRSPKTNE
jgi:hypothetical protein